jgi:thymidylate synthase ThyX
VFSRNAASSRAIPIEKMIERIRNDPAIPSYWGKNQRGMAAKEEIDTASKADACTLWLNARDRAIESANALVALGLHKQTVNRILEPWAHISVVITATEFDNFFNLRCDEAAQPEIQVLAHQMKYAMRDSVPVTLHPGDWHMPYITADERASIDWSAIPEDVEFGSLWFKDAICCSVARCARVSYVTHGDENANRDKDIAMHDSLLSGGHMSPFEHQAVASYDHGFRGNFRGWVQYRKMLPNEAVWKRP